MMRMRCKSSPPIGVAFLVAVAAFHVGGCTELYRDVGEVRLDGSEAGEPVDTGSEDVADAGDTTTIPDAVDTSPDGFDTEGRDAADTSPRDAVDTRSPDTVDADTLDTRSLDSSDTERPDTADTSDATEDGDLGDGGDTADTGIPVEPTTGDLVISEFMANPFASLDENGEWIEIYNPSTTQTYTLAGCYLRDENSTPDSYQFPSNRVLPPETYTTFAVSSSPGFQPDYTYDYSDFTLANRDDEIVLRCSSNVVDVVRYGDGTDRTNWNTTRPEGEAEGVKPSVPLRASNNDDGINWCQQQPSLPNNGDQGTPGQPNNCQ